MPEIRPIPAYTDNYIWLLVGKDGNCAVVDPGDHEPVLEVLERERLTLNHILLTHHHDDHIGGVPGLLEHCAAEIIGPDDRRITTLTRSVGESDRVVLQGLEIALSVIEVPGHTRSHIAFHGDGILFCGDTLFSIGCGRLFEGSPEQMQQSLDKLARLPEETQVYCGHEYTLSNCRFALEVEPGNEALEQYSLEVQARREAGKTTLPSRLETELAANPFLRTREPSVVKAAREHDREAGPGASTLAAIRSWKDRW